MANIDNSVIAENLTQLLQNSVNMTSVFYDIFLNPEPMDVELTQYNSDGELITIEIPNRAKDRKIALTGQGSPEGVVTANVGAVYVDESVEISADNPNGNGVVYFKAVGSGNTGWVTVLTSEGVNDYLRAYLIDNEFATINDISSYLSTHHYMTEDAVNAKFEVYNPTIPMTTLTGVSGNQSLTDNTGYSMSVTGATTFELPTPTDTSILHKIFIQLSMSPAQTITLAQSGVTLNYFDGIVPSMSVAGMYNIMYEYDNAAGRWVVGVLYKGTI